MIFADIYTPSQVKGQDKLMTKSQVLADSLLKAQLNALSYFENEILVLRIIPLLPLPAPPPPSFNHELLS